jgi:hypothetical protein
MTAAIPGEYLANRVTQPTTMQGDMHDVEGGGDVPPQASSIYIYIYIYIYICIYYLGYAP